MCARQRDEPQLDVDAGERLGDGALARGRGRRERDDLVPALAGDLGEPRSEPRM